MNQAARVWRADGGYEDVKQPPPRPIPVYYPAMNCYQGYPQWVCNSYYPFPPYQGTQYVEGPVPVAELRTTPPPLYGTVSPPPPPAYPPPGPEKDDKKEGKKDDDKKGAKAEKKEKKKKNPWAPPELKQNHNYMYDKEHTIIQIFKRAAPVWKEKYRTKKLGFKAFKVSVNFTIKMVIENTLGKTGDACKYWAATEVIERGSGRWDKGSTIAYDSNKATGTLNSMGWSVKRGGDALPPVWLVVHKLNFK